MQPMKSDTTTVGTRRAWEPPAITTFAIGTETKSPRTGEPGEGQAPVAQPVAAGRPGNASLDFPSRWRFRSPRASRIIL